MNRAQLIDAVAATTGLPRAQVEATLSATLAQVRGAVASGATAAGRHPGRGVQGRCHVQAGGRRQRHRQDANEGGGQKDPGKATTSKSTAAKSTAAKSTAAKKAAKK